MSWHKWNKLSGVGLELTPHTEIALQGSKDDGAALNFLQVGIKRKIGGQCSGSIITPFWIITAAYCNSKG